MNLSIHNHFFWFLDAVHVVDDDDDDLGIGSGFHN